MKTVFGLIALGWFAIGTVAGLLYLAVLVAGSWSTLGTWALYLLLAMVASLVALIIGANIWYTQFMNVAHPSKYRRFQPWLDRRAAKKVEREKAKKQDGQLSETNAAQGQVSMSGGCSLNPGNHCTHPKHMD